MRYEDRSTWRVSNTPVKKQISDEIQKALVGVLERNQSPLVKQLVRHGLATIDATNRAKQIIRHLDASWRLADRTVSYKLRQREEPGWAAYRDSWADSARRSVIVFEVFERNRLHDGSPRAVQKAVRGWTRKLTPPEHRISAKPMPAVEWGSGIAEALIWTLERELMRPLRFSRRPSGEIYGAELDVLVAMFEVAVRTGIVPDRKLLRGKGTRRPGSARWFANRIRRRRNLTKREGVRGLRACDIVAGQKRWNHQQRISGVPF